MNKTSKKAEANNFGPAAITMSTDGKGIEFGFGILMTGDNVKDFELNITKPETHTCVIDGDKAYRINEFGEIIRDSVDVNKMKETAKKRKAQGRKVEEKNSEKNEIR